ncbi:MAG: ATP-binding protein [Planctomycetota bacterium]|jgi:PAS domain S-box-containing protein
MFDSLLVIVIFCSYMALLFFGALWVVNKSASGRRLMASPIVYSLSLAVYCTSWTYYGSVGAASTSGMLFLTIYLGPTLCIVLWWKVLRKMVRIKNAQHITSIADFISARYNKSQSIAALATLGAFIGTLPYAALQLKSVITTFEVLTEDGGSDWLVDHVGPIVVILMIVFTIVFGVRHLTPTERHPGIIMLVAIESLVKLIAFLAAGIFITYFVFDGFGDIFERFAQREQGPPWAGQGTHVTSYVTWSSYLLLAMCAILFLPRQFHVAVVENSREKNITTAMWLFPLYMLLINIFVLPIAMGGILSGIPLKEADTFVLRLPIVHDKPLLALLVFMGGFSAATSMIMITSMTMATMLTNHLLLPVVGWFRGLGFLRRHLLRCRWVAVAVFILLGYWFERNLGESQFLISIGIISFAAALQFAPAILGGIYWPRGSKAGCMAGMAAGFAIWFYTMLLPSFVRSGWLPESLLIDGPLGLTFLRPEQLFWLDGLDSVSHGVFWSMLFNVGLYVTISVFGKQGRQEREQVDRFFAVLSSMPRYRAKTKEMTIELEEKTQHISGLLNQYFPRTETEDILKRCLDEAGIADKKLISVHELAEFHSRVESALAGAIGSAAAHVAMINTEIFTPTEIKDLTESYSEILAQLKVTPKDLKEKTNYYQEKEQLLTGHAGELEEKVREREQEIQERRKAEEALEEEKERLAVTLRSIGDGVITMDIEGRVVLINREAEMLTGWTQDEASGRFIYDILNVVDVMTREPCGSPVEEVLHKEEGMTPPGDRILISRDGTERLIASSGAPIVDRDLRIIGVVLVFCDVTEKRKMEEELLKVQKLESIGVLAGGIAHDFNNILTGIINNIYLARLCTDSEDTLKENLDETEKAAIRAQELTQQLLTFSKGGAPVKRTISISDLISDSTQFVLRGSNVRAECDIDDSLWLVDADEGQIIQVIHNLVLNADQAMPEGGTVEVKANNLLVEETSDLPIRPGRYVKISVRDYGHGISRDHITRIFDPYFTSKEKGHGLGLSTAYSIIEKHDGHITVDSEEGGGTTFDIYLPASTKEAQEFPISTNEAQPKKCKILLMDDEQTIRQSTRYILKNFGYEVECAHDGAEAIEMYLTGMLNETGFDLVIMDLTIPGGMGGKETVKKLTEIDPDVKVIVTSGYSNDPVMSNYKKYGFSGVITKPYDFNRLNNEIQRVLREGSSLPFRTF